MNITPLIHYTHHKSPKKTKINKGNQVIDIQLPLMKTKKFKQNVALIKALRQLKIAVHR